MSDEDRDVDIESDDDDESIGMGSTGGSTQFMTQAEKRAHHNALERKRRDHIKESFHSLRDSVPTIAGEKPGEQYSDSGPQSARSRDASRAQILKQATDYIQYMSKKNSTHISDIEDLKRQNQYLEAQVRGKGGSAGPQESVINSKFRGLEKTKVAGAFAATALDKSSHSGKGASAYASDSSESEDEGPKRRKKLKTS